MTRSDEPTPAENRGSPGGRRPLGLLAVAPLLALVALVALLLALDPLATLRTGAPPSESLTIERVVVTAEPPSFVVTVVNGGREPVTIAQVLVDEAFWPHEITPGPRLEPLATARMTVPYPIVYGEPHHLVILTSTGLTFEHTVDVALPTPVLDADALVRLALVGALVGLVPIVIGLLWYPFVRRLRAARLNAILAFTVGVLLVLGVEATSEALDLAALVPPAFDGTGALALSVIVAFTLLMGAGALTRGRASEDMALAMFIAVGIGMHNLGEGLAVAAAWSTGHLALTTMLIVGFAIHNSTEGVAIVAPLADQRPSLRRLLSLGLVAGAPTIVGTWIGAITYSPALAVVFLGLGVGAIAQVIWEVVRLIARRGSFRDPLVLAGFAAGSALMYLTGVLVST